MLVFWLAWFFAITYACLQGFYLYHWIKLPDWDAGPGSDISEGATVIIVAHNEADSIQDCITSVLQQSFPQDKLEIIVVDDHSTDDTYAKIKDIKADHLKCLRLKDHPEYIREKAFKKSAITLAVDHAQYEHIVVTDADCMLDPYWLEATLSSLIHHDLVFQTGPVYLESGNSLLEKMQEVEQLTFVLVTGAGISSGLHDIANGANMAFIKSAFKHVNGYEGNYHYASGDDMFLIEKMRTAYPNQVAFLKSRKAAVRTKGKINWGNLIAQRLRWAGKNKGLQRAMIKRIWQFVGLYHLLLLLTFVTAMISLAPWTPFLILLIVKWLSDYFVVNASATFFKRTEIVRLFVTLQMFYFWYILRLSFAMMLGEKGDWREERSEK